MQIKIEKIHKDGTGTLVQFTCPFGSGVGVWCKGDVQLHSNYAVEIDIDNPVLVAPGDSCEFNMKTVSLGIHITALLEMIQDGILCLRFGEDILQIEPPSPSRFKVGDWVQIETKEIQIYPYVL